MNKLICILFGFAVGTWMYLIMKHQEEYSEYEWYKYYYKELYRKCNEFFKVYKNLKTVKVLIKKTEANIQLYDFLSPRREKFQKNLKKLEAKFVELETKYDVMTEELDAMFSEHLDEVMDVSNTFNIKMLKIQDLYWVYEHHKREYIKG